MLFWAGPSVKPTPISRRPFLPIAQEKQERFTMFMLRSNRESTRHWAVSPRRFRLPNGRVDDSFPLSQGAVAMVNPKNC